jgi:hypothetical protein
MTDLRLVDQESGSLHATWRSRELFRYVYRPRDPQLESPRPYFHPLRTLGGHLVTLYRPHDHVWHKGLAWSLSNVGTENFWGGATFTRDRGYVQLPNNGTMRHVGFELIEATDGALRFDERLTWSTQAGETWIEEERRVTVSMLSDVAAWRLGFASTMRNASGATLPIGSPTTEGRPNSGYSGLFWCAPRSFSGGVVLTPDGEGGDELMGARGPWLAFVGRHDGHGAVSTLLFVDDENNPGYPTEWFVRSGSSACVCPAPFYSQVYELPPGDQLTLRYEVVVADGVLDVEACTDLVKALVPGRSTT